MLPTSLELQIAKAFGIPLRLCSRSIAGLNNLVKHQNQTAVTIQTVMPPPLEPQRPCLLLTS